MKLRIVRNAVGCLICGDVVESKYRHDFQQCSCGNIFTDGGLDYTHRGVVNLSGVTFIDLSEYDKVEDLRIVMLEEEEKKDILENFSKIVKNSKNKISLLSNDKELTIND